MDSSTCSSIRSLSFNSPDRFFLNGLTAAVDQAQLLLVHRGRTVEQLIDEPHLLPGGEPLDPAGSKIPDNGGISRADRDDQLLRPAGNTKRDCGVDALAGILDLDGISTMMTV